MDCNKVCATSIKSWPTRKFREIRSNALCISTKMHLIALTQAYKKSKQIQICSVWADLWFFTQSKKDLQKDGWGAYKATTWSRVGEHWMPDQLQGSASTAFQSDRTENGSSCIAALKFISAETAKIPITQFTKSPQMSFYPQNYHIHLTKNHPNIILKNTSNTNTPIRCQKVQSQDLATNNSAQYQRKEEEIYLHLVQTSDNMEKE